MVQLIASGCHSFCILSSLKASWHAVGTTPSETFFKEASSPQNFKNFLYIHFAGCRWQTRPRQQGFLNGVGNSSVFQSLQQSYSGINVGHYLTNPAIARVLFAQRF